MNTKKPTNYHEHKKPTTTDLLTRTTLIPGLARPCFPGGVGASSLNQSEHDALGSIKRTMTMKKAGLSVFFPNAASNNNLTSTFPNMSTLTLGLDPDLRERERERSSGQMGEREKRENRLIFISFLIF